MKSYEVLSGFCIRAGVDVSPGQQIELDENQARMALAKGWLREIPSPVVEIDVGGGPAGQGEPEHPEVGGTDVVVHQDPEVVHGDPEPENREPRPRRGRKEE